MDANEVKQEGSRPTKRRRSERGERELDVEGHRPKRRTLDKGWGARFHSKQGNGKMFFSSKENRKHILSGEYYDRAKNFRVKYDQRRNTRRTTHGSGVQTAGDPEGTDSEEAPTPSAEDSTRFCVTGLPTTGDGRPRRTDPDREAWEDAPGGTDPQSEPAP